MRKALKILSIIVAVGIAWIYLFTGTPVWGDKLKLNRTDVKSIDVTLGGKSLTISDSNQCVHIIETLQKARSCPAAATPAFGFLILNYPDGTTKQLYFSPAGRLFATEISGQDGGYAISTREVIPFFENVGLPMEK